MLERAPRKLLIKLARSNIEKKVFCGYRHHCIIFIDSNFLSVEDVQWNWLALVSTFHSNVFVRRWLYDPRVKDIVLHLATQPSLVTDSFCRVARLQIL